MDAETDNLYREVLLDHSKHPRNYRRLDAATGSAVGHNRLCGDKLRLFVRLDAAGVIADAAWQGSGCAISTASASMMTEAVKGHTPAAARALFRRFYAVVTGPPDEAADTADLGKLAVFAGVRAFPVRVKCATLAWHALEAALTNEPATVSTE